MLQAIHIRKQFQRSGEVLRDVSFTLGDGEFLSVIGPSGAGKTTLFRILNGTELCSGGEVLYGGTHFEAARGREKRALQQVFLNGGGALFLPHQALPERLELFSCDGIVLHCISPPVQLSSIFYLPAGCLCIQWILRGRTLL